MERECVNINPNPNPNPDFDLDLSLTQSNGTAAAESASKCDESFVKLKITSIGTFVGSKDDIETRLSAGLAWLGGMLVKHSPRCNSSEVLIAFNSVEEMLSTVRQVPNSDSCFGIGDLPKLADNPMRTGFVKSELMKGHLITGPEPNTGWGGPGLTNGNDGGGRGIGVGNIPANGQLRCSLVVHPSQYMLQTLDAIPEIFAMMVLSWSRNDIYPWIEARSPVNLEEVRFKNSNR